MTHAQRPSGRNPSRVCRPAAGLARPTVEAVERRLLFATYTVTTVADAGAGSLRQAILDANAGAGADTISFALPGAGPYTIAPTSGLPQLTGPTRIDGTTQPGYAGVPVVHVRGPGATPGYLVAGLSMVGDDSSVRGLAVSGWSWYQVNVEGARAVVAGNYLGLGPDGTATNASYADSYGGVGTRSVASRVGGTVPADRNVIGGVRVGVRVMGYSAGTVVQGNYIGLAPDGATARPGGVGVNFEGGKDVTIGGTLAAARNVIAACQAGISFGTGSAIGVAIEGNYIGTDATGGRAVPNGVGIDVDGGGGIRVGGRSAAARNVIAGNLTDGVRIGEESYDPAVSVLGNWIGLAAGGSPLGNGRDGVRVEQIWDPPATPPAVGGPSAGEANVIAHNGGAGVRVVDVSVAGTVASRNSIFGNGGLGIDVAGAGPTPNDPLDVDGFTNAPVLSATTLDGLPAVAVTLDARPGTTYAVELFATPAADAGQGQSFVAATFLTTDAAGHATRVVGVAPRGDAVVLAATATGTVAGAGTSEFSAGLPYAASSGPTAQVEPLEKPFAYSPLASATISFSRPVSGFDLADLRLTRAGRPDDLLPSAAASLTASPDARVWTLSGLAAVTAAPGFYTVSFADAAAVHDEAGGADFPAAGGQAVEVVPVRLSVGVAVPGPAVRAGGIAAATVTFSVPVVGFDAADLSLTRDGSAANLLPAAAAVTTGDGGLTWAVDGLAALTSTPGAYTLRVAAGAVVDAGQGPIAVPAAAAQAVTVVAPLESTFYAVGPPLRFTPVTGVSFGFTRPVSGLSLADLELTRDGGPNLLPSAPGAWVRLDANAYVVDGLSGVTAAPGRYRFGFGAAAAVVDLATGETAMPAGGTEWTVLAPVVGRAVDKPTGPVPRAPASLTLRFDRPIDGLDLADLAASFTPAVGPPSGYSLNNLQLRLDRVNATDWQLSGLDAVFSAPGTLRLYPAYGGGVTEPGVGPSHFSVDETYQIAPTLEVTIEHPDPSPRVLPVDRLGFTFSVPTTGFDLSDVRLTRDGQPVPLAAPAQAVAATDRGDYWLLTGLTSVTQLPGQYEVRVVAAGSGIAGTDGRPLEADAAQSWRVEAGGSVTLDRRAKADAYVRNGTFASRNFGSAADLQAGWSGLADGGRQSYLSFDISGLGTSTQNLHRAVLRLAGHTSDGRPLPVGLYVAPNTWTEAGVTYTNRPIPATQAVASGTVAGSADAWYEFDVSRAIMNARTAGLTTLTLAVKNLVTSTTYAMFASDESAAPPVLRVIQQAVVAQPKLVVTPTALAVREGGTAGFTVRLDAPVYGEVGVQVTRTAGDTNLTIANSGTSQPHALTLLFTHDNWSVPQTVVLAAAQDGDTSNGSASFLVAFDGTASKTVVATEADDDLPPPVVTKTLRATADAYVRDGAFAGQNFGSGDLAVRKATTGGQTRWTVLKFDLATVSAVTSATLRLFGRLDTTANPSVGVQAFAASNATWTEAGVTWANKPLAAGVALGTMAVAGTAGKWYALDLTAWLKAQRAAGKTTVSLVLTSPATTAATALFAGDEATTNRPELVVKS
jgi:hypothetical protein